MTIRKRDTPKTLEKMANWISVIIFLIVTKWLYINDKYDIDIKWNDSYHIRAKWLFNSIYLPWMTSCFYQTLVLSQRMYTWLVAKLQSGLWNALATLSSVKKGFLLFHGCFMLFCVGGAAIEKEPSIEWVHKFVNTASGNSVNLSSPSAIFSN